jgi:hypothetical protein
VTRTVAPLAASVAERAPRAERVGVGFRRRHPTGERASVERGRVGFVQYPDRPPPPFVTQQFEFPPQLPRVLRPVVRRARTLLAPENHVMVVSHCY